eukprot:831126-Amphidinium_carterae.1
MVGHRQAQAALGELLLNGGEGLPPSPESASCWLKLAAEPPVTVPTTSLQVAHVYLQLILSTTRPQWSPWQKCIAVAREWH